MNMSNWREQSHELKEDLRNTCCFIALDVSYNASSNLFYCYKSCLTVEFGVYINGNKEIYRRKSVGFTVSKSLSLC